MVNSIFTNRRAVRNFSSESISDDEIKSLIAAFQTTPCGMHQTDVISLVVVKDEALRDKIETKTDNACYHAPVLFIINTACLASGMHPVVQIVIKLQFIN